MLRGRDIVCISSIDWDFIWQGHQEIMSTLAAHGNRILFIENTGVRAPQLRDLPRLRHRLRNWRHGTKGFREVRENLVVYAPVILPFPYSHVARWINRRLLMTVLRRWMRAAGFGRPIVWTFLPTPLIREVIADLDPELSVYYCIDDFASSSPQARRIRSSEDRVFREADLVFVTSEKLRERAARFNARVHLFPFGVRFDHFEKARTALEGVPDDLRRLPRPVVGYVGGVHQWVDQELLAQVAQRMPQASFVLIGPAQTDVSRLAQQSNIHLLQARPHAVVPQYMKGFDVGIISYRLSDYTAHVYPTKLNEYLAMGIPVVATDLPEIRRFNREHGNVVRIVRDANEFRDALEHALRDRRPEAQARRIDVARQNSWQRRIEAMSTMIDTRMAERRAGSRPWDVTLRRLYRAARSRVAGAALGALLVYSLIFRSSFVWWVAQPLAMAEPARAADAIVVFAGGVGESGKAGGGYQERVKRAVDLYREGRAPVMVFSSGYVWAFREAEIMRDLALTHGVPASAIILEQRATNTRDNVILTAEVLRAHGWKSALLVSSPYHMRRAILTWRKQARDIAAIPTPVVSSQFYAHERGASLEQIQGILHEYAALAKYWWKGWL